MLFSTRYFTAPERSTNKGEHHGSVCTSGDALTSSAKPRLHRGDAVSGGNKHSDERTPRHIPGVQVAFRVLMIRWILQFALRIAFRCVLHRCGSQDIRR